MIALLQSQLPSGLSVINIGGTTSTEFTQRVEYPFVCRTKTAKSPSSAKEVVIASSHVHRSHRTQSCIMDDIMRNVDDMYDLYNERMRLESKTCFMTHIRDFVGSATGTSLVGRKASREIMAYVAQWQRYRGTVPESFMKLCSFLLDARIHYDGKTYEWPGVEMQRDVHLKK